MRSVINRLYSFSTGKYFKDLSFTNVTAIAYDTPGALSNICRIFFKHGVSLSYLRTHCQSHKKGNKLKYRLEISLNEDHIDNFGQAKIELQSLGIILTKGNPIIVPWFPRTLADVDLIGHQLLDVNEGKEHTQFQDIQYVNRRNYIAQVAQKYKMGQRIPDVDYTPAEHQLWRNIYKRLAPLHKQAMCQRFLKVKKDLDQELKISDRIPQLSQLSDYIKSKTGFIIKPTHGILSQREFLNSFAFKIFCSTQYLRNVKNPEYTPQPDIVHEILGHVPMFADPQVAELSQTLGLLSLGASDQDIARLGALYWWTIEFGVCKEKNQIKGYGAGVASSIGQIEHMLGRGPQKPNFEKLNVYRDCNLSYPVQTVQPTYKVTESFQDSLNELQLYGRHIMKPITTVFNQETESIQYDRSIEAVWAEDKGPKF